MADTATDTIDAGDVDVRSTGHITGPLGELPALQGEEAVDAAINALFADSPAAVSRSLASQLYDEAQAEAIQRSASTMTTTNRKNIWTFDRMRKQGPLPGDLYGDGEFLFSFKPVLGSTYAQERFLLAERFEPGDTKGYVEMQIAYAEVVFFALQGCTWPVRETVQDPVTGQDIIDRVPVLDAEGKPTGEYTEEVRSVPLPITLDNVKKVDADTLIDFLNAMKRAVSGETSTKP